MVHTVFNPDSPLPAIGASGAVAGVMSSYFISFPFAKVIVMVPVFIWPFFFEVPAVVFFLLWFWSQLIGGLVALSDGTAIGGIAWWAHIGGFVSGLVLLPFFRRNQ